jgi:hypothetical protein
MSIGPILLSFALFAFWAALGWSVLALAEPAMPSLRSLLLAPLIGVSVSLLPVYWLSLVGVPVAVIARPLLALYCLVAIVAWTWRPPAWTPRELIFLLPIIAAIVIFGFPAIWFGLDWVGNANDDWANYSLSAIRFLRDGYYQQPSIEAMRSGLYYPGFLWFLNVAASARSGSDLLLAWVAGAVGNNPFFVFMPVILALHGVFACSAAALAAAFLNRRVLLAAVILMAIAPLNLYAVHQQLIAQVAGLGLMCALGALTLVDPQEFDKHGRIALIAVVAAAYLLTYPETVFIFGIALVLYHARRAADVGLKWESFRRLLIAPAGPASCSGHTASAACSFCSLRFTTVRIRDSMTAARSSHIFWFQMALLPCSGFLDWARCSSSPGFRSRSSLVFRCWRSRVLQWWWNWPVADLFPTIWRQPVWWRPSSLPSGTTSDCSRRRCFHRHSSGSFWLRRFREPEGVFRRLLTWHCWQ